MAQTVKQSKLIHALRVGPQGRVVIPARLRRQLQIKQGDTMVAWMEHDQLILRPRQKVEEEIWRQFGDIKTSLADEIVAERREESRREKKG